MPLTESSKKYWHPIQKVMDYVGRECIKPGEKVLEIGPGTAPLARADVYVDFVDIPDLKDFVDRENKQFLKCDLNTESLPFKDKEFDFCFTRHMLEDMCNPFNLIKEMSRVAKAGYIETPSPFAEMGRGVDVTSPPFRGYHHHRYILWTYGSELRIVSKYPLCEYIKMDEALIEKTLEEEKYWNTYHVWSGEIKLNHFQSPLNFNIPKEYGALLNKAMEASRESTDIFWFNLERRKVA